MKVYPFRAGHLENLLLQPAQAHLREFFTPEYIRTYENGLCYSLVADDGSTLACAGLLPIWENRASAWALLSADLGPRGLLIVTRACLRELNLGRFRRVEAYVDPEFMAARKWVRALGFRFEGHMAAFTPEGRDHDLYARVQ
jgi:hypothetical protein